MSVIRLITRHLIVIIIIITTMYVCHDTTTRTITAILSATTPRPNDTLAT